jgi:hypothetical protein
LSKVGISLTFERILVQIVIIFSVIFSVRTRTISVFVL